MKELFQRLEAQLQLQFPDILPTLNPPATEAQITAFEAAVKQKLPEDVKTTYRWHNGCRGLPAETSRLVQDEPYFLVYRGRWLCLDEMLDRWQSILQIGFVDTEYHFTEEDDPDNWNRLTIRPWTAPPHTWLPLSQIDNYSFTYIDLFPGPRGRVGQFLSHCIQDGGDDLIADSLENYLTVFVQALERKELQYDRRYQQWLGLHEALEKAKTLK
jgi:cell wall assembly regulator SMI1